MLEALVARTKETDKRKKDAAGHRWDIPGTVIFTDTLLDDDESENDLEEGTAGDGIVVEEEETDEKDEDGEEDCARNMWGHTSLTLHVYGNKLCIPRPVMIVVRKQPW